jgi:chorismate mutase/prephenate dehydratase
MWRALPHIRVIVEMAEEDIRARLAALRDELGSADRALVIALAQRTRIVDTIAALKTQSQLPLRDPERERLVLEHVEAVAESERLDPHLVNRIFREIIEQSLRVQEARLHRGLEPTAGQMVTIGYQGAEGAYSHQAARRYFSPWHEQSNYHAYATFREMLDAVRTGAADYAMLPVENTTAGSVNEAYDLLAAMNLAIVGEEIQPIDHCLIGVASVDLAAILRVYSHPQALAQCSEFLSRMPWCQVEEFSNTSLAARRIAEQRDPSQAAIASEEVARLLGMPVLARNIANQQDNYTRFLVIASSAIEPPGRLPCKTSVMFVTRHERGALVTCLNELAARGLNLTKIESRPRPGAPWEYQFYVDFEGNTRDPVVQDALRALATCAFFLKVFGSYVARTTAEGASGQLTRSQHVGRLSGTGD